MKHAILILLAVLITATGYTQTINGLYVTGHKRLEAKRAFVLGKDTLFNTTQLSGIDTTLATSMYVNNKVSDGAYDPATWIGVTTIAPSKNAVAQKIESMVQVFYCPAFMTVNRGTLDAGNAASLCAVGGTDVNISELTGADPLRVTFVFTNVDRLNYFVFFGNYAGSTSHINWVEILNPATNTWSYAGQFLTSTTKQWYSFPIFQPATYIRNDSVQVRINHQGTGVSTHDMILDYVDVNFGGSGGGSVSNASSVSFAPTATVSATNVQAAIEEVSADLNNSGFITYEEDGSVTNEGVLGIAELSSNGVRVTSNTNGAAGFAITGGTGITLGWTLGTNGGGVTINSTAAPVDAPYLVATTNSTLTNEIAVGATPGGVLGGTWAAPTLRDGTVTHLKFSTYAPPANGNMLTYSSTYGLTWATPLTGSGVTGRLALWNGTQNIGNNINLTYNTSTNTLDADAVTVNTEAYNRSIWDGNLRVPTMDALSDKFETLPAANGATGLVQLSNGAGGFTSDANISFSTATNTLTVDTVKVINEPYTPAGWDGDLSAPTKDALKDKFESMNTSYDSYFINSTTNLTAGVDKYIDVFTTGGNTPSTIYAIIDMHIDQGEGTYSHTSGNFSSAWVANAITRQNWTAQYYDYATTAVTMTPVLVDNGITATFRIKFNSPVTSSHHYVISIKYLHK